MKIRAALMACLAASTAYADGKHTLVMKSDGNADGKTRAQIDAAVLKLAKGSVEGVTPGDISFNDAAAAVGCTKPDAPTCKDDVIGMLSVDEIITTVVTRKPGGLEVTVRREGKSGSPRDATAKIADANDPQLESQLGVIFGMATATPPTPIAVIEPAKPDVPIDTPPSQPTTPPTDIAPPMQPMPPLAPVEDQQHTRLQISGMVGGGALLLLGFVMWGQASGTQSDIDSAPAKTVADLQHIQQLEKQGDGQASLGNLLFVGGLALAGVSTYFFIRDRGRRHDRVTTIAPTLFPHGAGLALTIGGLP